MNAQNTWSTAKRLLLVLGLGLLLVLVWMGGRMSAGGGGPMEMMGAGMHGESMGQGQHRQGGDGSMMRSARADSGDAFAGEAGMQRCRAMMGTMAGMLRSMQSMMGGTDRNVEGKRENSRGQIGRGMMDRGMGGMHGGGGMHERMRSMHDRMGAMMGGVAPERMRRLCRTMQEAMRAAMHGPVADSLGQAAEKAITSPSLSGETKQWLRGARGFESVEDRTGKDEVVVEVGGGDGLQYGPAAVRVSSGTTIRWRWTGRGGLHNVAFANIDVSTSLKGEEGATFTHTFDTPGEYRYECTPHAGIGMRGAIIVAEEE